MDRENRGILTTGVHHEIMRLSKSFLIVAVSAALCGAMAETGHAQTASRGSAKVRPRFFNPFAAGRSRLALNPFGIFSVAQPSNSSVPEESSTTTAVSSTGGSEEDLGETLALGAVVRPPYRPPTRSPFRPPPRPPF